MVAYRDRNTKKYTKNLFGALSIGVGAFLIIEHIIVWGEFSIKDLIGHEWLGLVLIIVGIWLNISFKTDWSIELKKLFSKFSKQ